MFNTSAKNSMPWTMAAALAFLAACGGPQEALHAPQADQPLLYYGDQEMTVRDGLVALQENIDLNRLRTGDPIQSASQTLSALGVQYMLNRQLAQNAQDENLHETESFQNYRRQIIEQELYQKVIVEDVLQNIQVAEEDLRQFYEENRETLFLMKDSNVFHIRGIVVSKGDKGRAEASRLINEAYQKLERGLNFQSVARDYSDSPVHLRGRISQFSPRTLGPDLTERLKQLKDGEYTSVIETDRQFKIIQRVEYTPPEYRRFEASKSLIKQELTNQRTNRRMFLLLEELRGKFDYLINPDLLSEDSIPDPETVILSVGQVMEFTYREFMQKARQNGHLRPDAQKQYLEELSKQALCLAEAKSRGWTEADVRHPVAYWAQKELAKQYLIDKLGSLSREEMDKIYQRDKNESYLMTPKQIWLSHLFFRVPGLNRATRYEQEVQYQAAQQKAHKALAEIKNGRPFAEVAALYAPDDSAAFGGDMGWVNFNEITPSIQEILSTLDAGEISRPQRISNLTDNRFGYEIFFVRDVREPEPLAYTQALAAIAQREAQKRFYQNYQRRQEAFLKAHPMGYNQDAWHKTLNYLAYLINNPDKKADLARYLY